MRMSFLLKCLPVALSVTPAVALADACDAVVADTVAEVRAGATGAWDDSIESVVRAAAGSACVKATSGRYGGSTIPVESADADATTARRVPADDGMRPETGTTGDVSEDDGLDVGGLTFRGMSGSPGRKPYERQRDQARAEDDGVGEDERTDGR